MNNSTACRDQVKKQCWGDAGGLVRDSSHAGLLLARYLEAHDSNREKIRTLLRTAATSVVRVTPLYTAAYQRWEKSLEDCRTYPCHREIFSIHGRMVIGLGGASVLETGLTLHHTYGTPMIPGPALKGLAAHYCHQVWGAGNPEFLNKVEETDEKGKKRTRPGTYYTAIFGRQDDAGHITFHDAWITPDRLGKSLKLDVMTPHHQEYYGEPSGSNKHPPTDFDDPIPVSFLSVTGDFLVAVSCDVAGEAGQQWADLAFQLLGQALEEWGIGGKTNAGYGRMTPRSAAQGQDGENRAEVGSPIPEPEPPRPMHSVGDKVEAVRVEDSKKGKKRFEAENGFRGGIVIGEVPEIAIGEKTTLWVAAAMKEGYNFRSTDPGAGKVSGGKKLGKGKGKGR